MGARVSDLVKVSYVNERWCVLNVRIINSGGIVVLSR